jgi:hypothetical protein
MQQGKADRWSLVTVHWSLFQYEADSKYILNSIKAPITQPDFNF